MRFGDLPAERQTNSGPAGLRREKRNEQVCRIHNPGSGIADENFHAFREIAPAGCDRSLRFERSFRGVVQNIDEQLFQLRGIGVDGDVRARNHAHCDARLEIRHPFDQLAEIDRFHLRLWQPREPGIGLHETAERFRSRRDDVQSAPRVVPPIGRRWIAANERLETTGD